MEYGFEAERGNMICSCVSGQDDWVGFKSVAEFINRVVGELNKMKDSEFFAEVAEKLISGDYTVDTSESNLTYLWVNM